MTRRRKQKCLLLFILLLLMFIVFALHEMTPPKVKGRFSVGPRQGSSPFITTFPPRNTSSKTLEHQEGRVKTILLWTYFFGSKMWLTSSSTFRSCAVKTCRVTDDKAEMAQADAVLMNVRNIYTLSDLPPARSPHQVWIIHGSEPPYYVTIDLESFNNVFNWTSWYRSDADIFSAYGHFAPKGPVMETEADDRDRPPSHHHHLSNTSHTPPPRPPPSPDVFQPNYLDEAEQQQQQQQQEQQQQLEEEVLHSPADLALYESVDDPFGLHDLLVFWAASSCINFSQRYKLVHALREHLPVDTYGFCGERSCLKGSRECHSLLKRYKFVLAFENGYCRDYVTEKYWNALSRNQIPIVSGGADYSKVAIPGSYIDVDDFPSVESLANYILRVASDRRLYNSFFAWRSAYRRLVYGISNWCQMCAALHDEARLPQVYSDFRGWVTEDTCPVHSVFHHFRWIFQYVVFKILGI